ncbi:MAG: hypothetical protein ACR2H6_00830 [Pyrinomonadaceae bacterium]
MFSSHGTTLNLVALLCSFALTPPTLAQTAAKNEPHTNTHKQEIPKDSETDSLALQQRTFAISLVTSVAEEARGYQDLALRSRVLARAADTLWEAESETARLLFRRAWEAAEKGDAAEPTLKTPEGFPQAGIAMVTALRRISGHDLRAGVLAVAARRDRALGEEFLNKLQDATKREAADSKDSSNTVNAADSWSNSEAASKRLQLARRLLDDGEIDRAMEFAAPLLDMVNANSILFLSALREKRPEAADQRFAFLLAGAENDPSSDANTASGLSSYVFTPGVYVTFFADGNARWSQSEETTAPPNLSPALRNRFFQAAGSILLRPLPPPDQDFTSSGRIGKYMIVKRLLPLFEQYAPDMAVALRSQLSALMSDGPSRSLGDDSPLLTQGLQSEETPGKLLETMQERLDHAKNSLERDRIYADAAVALANQGDARALDLADKIGDSERRGQVRRYVDFQFVKLAIRKKNASEVARLAKAGQLTHTERVWAYTQAARLLINSERPRSLELLEEAAAEARRIGVDDPDRASSLIAVAKQFVTADRVRAWETLAEAAKAANANEKFTGDNVQIHSAVVTRSGLKISSISGEDFSLTGVLWPLAKDDLYRSIDLAKSFKNDAPRAAALLAIADAMLKK